MSLQNCQLANIMLFWENPDINGTRCHLNTSIFLMHFATNDPDALAILNYYYFFFYYSPFPIPLVRQSKPSGTTTCSGAPSRNRK